MRLDDRLVSRHVSFQGLPHECCKLKENMVEHELRNRWKRSYLGKLELNRTPLSLQHSTAAPPHVHSQPNGSGVRVPMRSVKTLSSRGYIV
jgi:hypothetical protein